MSEKTILTKKQILLDFTDTAQWESRDGSVEHGGTFYESDDSDVCLFLTAEDWREMGRPRELTLTIEPGDRLNEPDDAAA